MKTFLLYGSYGYTGELIADRAVQNGMRPLLAGRDETRLKAQAQKLGLDYRAFDLSNTAALDSTLMGVDAVLHCAGPFVLTFRQMAEACLRTKRHYVDISGEIEGFEALAALDAQAKNAGIMLLPGAGFDVVPSDCLSAHLKQKLPSADHLRLFIRQVGSGVSRGTAKSGIENMHRQGRIRKDGKVIQVPPAWKFVNVDFGRGPVKTVSIGWGDVSTAYYSTGIPNIETFMVLPRTMTDFLHVSRLIGPLLNTRLAKNIMKSVIDSFPSGPSEESRKRGLAIIIGEATDSEGGRVRAKLQTPDGYSLTAQTTVEIMKRILSSDPSTGSGQRLKPGFQTPSLVYGPDFILQFPNTKLEDL
ncbi:MAG: saccharopine dehydrogenase NADP-binding domain-containing protein [Chloroflexi bacterium]|nr:saccharopine dehydrogenase NADP-binding domain-containing protein [Chloroflexota bacterium]